MQKEESVLFEQILDEQKILVDLVQRLKEHKSTEQQDVNVIDKGLVGYLNLLAKLMEGSCPETSMDLIQNYGLLQEIFFKCLFPCQSKPSFGDAEGY